MHASSTKRLRHSKTKRQDASFNALEWFETCTKQLCLRRGRGCERGSNKKQRKMLGRGENCAHKFDIKKSASQPDSYSCCFISKFNWKLKITKKLKFNGGKSTRHFNIGLQKKSSFFESQWKCTELCKAKECMMTLAYKSEQKHMVKAHPNTTDISQCEHCVISCHCHRLD